MRTRTLKPVTAILLVVLALQLFSLFRTLPISPACGKIQDLGHGARVLINCDSAVFMKDAQDPLRLYNGKSVYQDRPAYAGLNWLVSTALTKLGMPDKRIEVTGNSGIPTNYSEIFYLTYLVLNFLTLSIAIWLIFKWLNKELALNVRRITRWLVKFNVLLLISANEITKTYFWTPHSQMFNILLPCYALYLFSNFNKLRERRYFLTNAAIIGLGLFFYSLLGVLFLILIMSSYKKLRNRIAIILFAVAPWVSLPFVIQLTGGYYHSIAFSRYREYVWVIDGLTQGDLLSRLATNSNAFLHTFPLIPVTLIISSLLFLHLKKNSSAMSALRVWRPEIIFVIIYFVFFGLMGYYARRVTLGPLLFVELLIVIELIKFLVRRGMENTARVVLACLFLLQICSWVFTMGPMV